MATVEAVPMVVDRLRPVERQWRDLVWLRGIGSVLLGVGLPLTTLLIVDLFVNLPSTIRAAGLVTTVVLGMISLWRRLIVPLWRGVEAADVATWLEQVEPRLQERLLTSLELEEAEAPTSRAARLMQKQVRRETFSRLEEVDFAAALPPERAYRTLGLGLLNVALVLAPFTIWMSGYGLSWQRLSAPFGNWGWGRDYRIVAEQGDRFVARGSDAEIRVTVESRRGGLALPENLTLAWRNPGAYFWDERRLSWSDAEKSFVATLPRLTTDAEFVVKGPAAESPFYSLRVVDPPQLLSLTAAIDPPAYTGQPSMQTEVSGELQVCAGSRVRVQAVFDRAVSRVELDWPVPPPENDSVTAAAGTNVLEFSLADRVAQRSTETAQADARATASGMFVVRWRSPEGFLVEDPPRRLIVVPDQPPHVRLNGPASISVQPDERHEVSISASDDYGLTAAELHAETAPGERQVIPLPRDPALARNFEWPWTIDLADLGIQHGQAVSLRVRVVDNCEVPAPQERWSDAQVVVVSNSAPSAATRTLAAQTQAARQELQEMLREIADLRNELRDIHQKTAAATVRQNDAEQQARLEELQQRQAELAAEFEQWQEQLPESGPWDAIAESAQKLGEEELSKIEQGLERASEAEPREAIEAMSRTLDEYAAAQRALQQLDDDIRSLGNLGDELGELARLANRSERLAESLEQQASNADVDPAAAMANDLQTAEQLQQDLDQLLAEQPQLRAALEAFQQQQADAGANRAETLAENQRDLAEAINQAAATTPGDALNAENSPMAADGGEPSEQFGAGEQLVQQARQLAEQGVQLASDVGESTEASPEARSAASSAAEALQQLANAAAQGDFAAANEAAQSASQEIASASSALPEAEAEAGQQAGDLAEGLNELQSQLEAMLPNPAAQRGAQAAGQEQIAQTTAELAEGAAAALGSTPAAEAATSALQNALSAMQSTRQSLSENSVDSAIQQAEAAAEQLEQAAQALAAMGGQAGTPGQLSAQTGAEIAAAGNSLSAGRAQLQAQSEPASGQPAGGQPAGTPMTSEGTPQGTPSEPSQGNGSPAGNPTGPPADSQPGPPNSMAQAASEFRGAAEALRRAAQSANGTPQATAQRSNPNPAQAGTGGEEPNNAASPAAAASLAGGGNGVPSGARRNWGRLGGTLETDLLDAGPLATHPEYSRQIQHYFQTIAQQPGAASPAPAAKAP